MLFNNVTVVCQTGLSFSSNKAYEVFFIKKHFIDMQFLDQVGFKSFVNFVQGRVTKLNRKEKTLIIDDNCHLKYDLLFMMSGELFQRPLKFNKYPIEERPENVFIINTRYDTSKAISKLKQLCMKNKNVNCKFK